MSDAAKRYHAYRMGWIDGANVGALRPDLAESADESVSRAYSSGYKAGRAARNTAMEHAATVAGYEPCVLRAANGGER